MKEITISNLECGQSAFKYVKKYLNNAPLGYIEKAFRKKDIKVNGHWVDKTYILKENDVLRIYIKDEQLKEFNERKASIPTTLNSEIVYEDNNILIINKKKGVLVHEDKNEKVHTLSNEVIAYLTNKGEYSKLMVNAFAPAPAHRLDRNTSGLIVFAKNFESLQILEELFKEKKELDKYYLALVEGTIKKDGVINAPLLKDSNTGIVRVDNNGKSAISEYKVIKNYAKYTLVEVHLITGRTHQIRVHMAYINHPIVGDSKYGNFEVNKEFNKTYKYNSQFLIAYKLVFHQIKGKLSYLSNKTFKIDFDKNERAILDSL